MATTSVIPFPQAPAADYLPPVDSKAVEQAMLIGDLSRMSDEQRIAYYVATCRSLGLNPLTKPFQALKDDDGKLRLYPDKGCAEQLRKRDRVSTKVLGREILDGLYIVTVQARTPDGREEEAQGIVPLVKNKGRWEDYDYRGETRRRFKPEISSDGQEVLVTLSPAERANAMKRAETQAKRRATLAICGLGMPDYDGEPESPAHPMPLTLQATSGPISQAQREQAVVELFGEGSNPTAYVPPAGSPEPAGAPEAQQGANPAASAAPPSTHEAVAGGHTYTVDPETGQLLGADGQPLPNLMQGDDEEPHLFGGDN